MTFEKLTILICMIGFIATSNGFLHLFVDKED